MSWINEHKLVWRVAILALVPVAIVGPWTLDRINVPSEYPCSPPTIRLEGDFCGTPLSGTWIFRWMIYGLIYASAGLVTGATVPGEWARMFFTSLLFSLLVLPFFSTLLLILRGDRRRRQLFNAAAWGLAAGMGLVIGLSSYPRLFWVLWGNWLYVGLAAGALILEAGTLAPRERPDPGG